MKNSIILVSGGMDSITLLYERSKDIAMAISFDYGANHNKKEISFAKLHCGRLGIKHITIPLSFMADYFKSSLLEETIFIPERNYNGENKKSTVVPFRNGIILSIACGIAESHGLKKILIANHFDDCEIYPDCRESFIDAMTSAMKNGTYNRVVVDAPYVSITKANIARKGKAVGVNFMETWTCYKGEAIHCGECSACIERKKAFKDAGIEDLTKYAK